MQEFIEIWGRHGNSFSHINNFPLNKETPTASPLHRYGKRILSDCASQRYNLSNTRLGSWNSTADYFFAPVM